MDNRIIIIDGNSLLNRAYYAMQRPMITKDGIYTQGIYGFLNMLSKIKNDYGAGYIAVAFDKKAPTFRHKEYKEYKAGRKKMPPELAMQLPLLKDVLDAMKIRTLEMDGFEADDIIGTVARKAEKDGLRPLIITGDKDELQLATDVTRVIITRRGISNFDIYDADAMLEQYGFSPQQFIDFKGLMGDPSDNIPGVPGVGEKTAWKLIMEYGSIEKLLDRLEDMPEEKLRKKIDENRQLALMSKRLATIDTDVPLELSPEECLWQEPDTEKLVDIYVKLEFNSFLRRLKSSAADAAGDRAGSSQGTAAGYDEINISEEIKVDSREKLELLADTLKKEKHAVMKVFSDGSHINKPVVFGTAVLTAGKYFFAEPDMTGQLADILGSTGPGLSGHDLKNDYYALMNEGVSEFRTDFDTAVAQYVLDPGRSNYSLKVLAQEYLHADIQEEKDFLKENGQMDLFSTDAGKFFDYGKLWCRTASAVRKYQQKKLEDGELEKVYYDIEMPLVEVMAYMEHTGFRLDRDELDSTGKSISARIAELTEDIYDAAGEKFNINSPAQLGPILFEKLGLPKGKKTKRGYSTNAAVLEKLRDRHKIAPMILEYRMLTKLRGTYIDGLLPLVNADGKIHAHFNQTATATGRISCLEPNLQNIPVRQELGRSIRKAFIPSSKDYILTGADYSQIELRVLAHMSGDEGLIEAFNSGDDIHRMTASRVMGIPENEITAQQRNSAKAVNFGVIYGMSAFGLSSELKISRKEAEQYINGYFQKHKAVKEFMDSQVASCRENGFVKTIFGRKRYIKEISASGANERQSGERLAMNSPIQGSAADIIKLAMVKTHLGLRKGGYRSRLILQVHDELIIETHKDEKEAVAELLMESMESALDLRVKLTAELNTGKNWYDLK